MEGMSTTTQLTWEEFERLPEQPGKQELWKGELIELPPAKFRHLVVSKRIYKSLDGAVDEAHARGEAQNLGQVYHEGGYRLGQRTWLQPDVSITHAGQTIDDYMENSPAIAIEVVSPVNTPKKLEMKTKLYFEFGALEVWHFYPDKGHVVVHRVGAEPVTEREGLTTPLLPGFTLNVAEILRG